MSVLQNSREEALNRAFKGDQADGENNIIQELTRAIVEEVKKMSGNDGCCDCGAAGGPRCPPPSDLEDDDEDVVDVIVMVLLRC